jgi:hypothetical protein
MESANNSDNSSSSETNKRIKKTDDMKQYMREYRKKHADKWKEQKVCPDCGVSYMASNITNHLRSQNHKYHVLKKEYEKITEKNLKTENNLKV